MPTDAFHADVNRVDVARTPGPNRRGALRAIGALAAGSGVAVAPPAARSAVLPRVAIIGGGMSGMACAWLLEGAYDIHLFEAQPTIGGNVQSLAMTVDGQDLIVDVGAQYFHPGPYPTYVALLSLLGLYPASTGGSHAFNASITVDDAAEAQPRFVSPVLPGRAWPLLAPWNRSGLEAFSTMLRAAKRREQNNASWFLSVRDWLPTLNLTPAQIDTVLLPWIASLYSGDIDEARSLSARAALVFAAKAAPENPLEPQQYHVLDRGMVDPLNRMAAQFSSVALHTAAPVTQVSRLSQGGFRLQASGQPALDVDQLVFASSGPPTLALLQGLSGTAPQRSALQGIGFFGASLAIHRDAAYVAQQPAWRSFLNCRAQGPFCEASMDLARVLPPAAGATSVPPLWKSWVTHRQSPPAEPLHTAHFQHMLPSLASLQAQQQLAGLQGQGGLWFAGGYLQPFDAQETALLSAMAVAQALNPAGQRLAGLRQRAA